MLNEDDLLGFRRKDELLDALEEEWKGRERNDQQVDEYLALLALRGLSIREIARVSSMPKSTVGYRLKRGREAVERMLNHNKMSHFVVDSMLFMELMIEDACRDMHEAPQCTYRKLRAMKSAANLVLNRYRILRRLGLIESPDEDLEQLQRWIKKATLPELEARKEQIENAIVGRHRGRQRQCGGLVA